MPTLRDLLARGYFPKELPTPFTTEAFADYITTNQLVADYAKPITGKPKLKSAKACRYSLARGGLQRRPLSICHPVIQFLLSREIVVHWQQLMAVAGGTHISATHPEAKLAGRAIDGHYAQSARAGLAMQSRLGRRYLLRADVSRFYSSIYTHSIPWAIHTKPVAKANRTNALLGNRLDFLVRMGQDQQTIGIPIGPDTSLVIAEVLMQRCDVYLINNCVALQGSRFVDDFDLNFSSQAEAEDAHHKLEACLADYELALNPTKTSIKELPLPLEAVWVTSLKKSKPRVPAQQQAADLPALFDLAFSLSREYPGEAVLQFAISLLKYETIDPSNWEQYQQLLMLCALPEPACFPIAIKQIVERINGGAGPLIPEIAAITNSLIITHSPVRHSSEVANALWTCLALGLTITDIAVDAVSVCEDPVVALLALDCESRHLTAKPLNKDLWTIHMNGDSLYDDYWLLAYEANLKGWLPSVGGTDFVMADPNFSILKTAGVEFYKTALVYIAGPAAPLSVTLDDVIPTDLTASV